MEIRHYEQAYEHEVVELWNRCLSFDPITVKKFRAQALFDDNFDPELCFMAMDHEQVIGFVLGMKRKFPYLERGLEPTRGWVSVIFVHPSYRRQGIGQRLYDETEAKLKAMGAENITLGAYSPSYFFAGLDPDNYPESIAFFEKNSYVAHEQHYSMGRDLHGYRLSEKVLTKKQLAEEKGYRFEPFTYRYALELLEFLRVEFGGGWKRNALIAMREETAEDLIYLVFDPQGKICGFVMRSIDGNPMRFGPIGISAKERNSGLGSILLELQLYEMCRRGIYRMYFITTDDAGRRYYERLGLSVIRKFIDYRKEL